MKKFDFFKFKNSKDDFPFYNGKPTNISNSQSFFLIFICILSVYIFQSINMPKVIKPFFNLSFILLAFITITKSNWTQIFRKIHFEDIKLTFILTRLNLIISFYVLFFLYIFFNINFNSNPVSLNANNTLFENIKILLKLIPALLGEDLTRVVPFLCILQLSKNLFNISKKISIIISWSITSISFGLFHLPTYNWNLIQCIYIGVSSIIPFYSYIKTKNILLLFGVHYLHDLITLIIFPLIYYLLT
ncbi:hypothetical protein QYB71_002903 [Clostridium perfringens]|nr:hypothetical protein [Clostridium perfringens]